MDAFFGSASFRQKSVYIIHEPWHHIQEVKDCFFLVSFCLHNKPKRYVIRQTKWSNMQETIYHPFNRSMFEL